MAKFRSIVFLACLYATSCSNVGEDLLFNHEYENLCAAYDDISRFAAHVHMNGQNRNYEDIRVEATKSFANEIEYDLQSNNTKDCEDIDEIVHSQDKWNKTQVYSGVLHQFMQTLDAHSLYIPQDSLDDFQKDRKNISRSFGVEFKYIHRIVKMTQPLESLLIDYVYPGTAASKSLEQGDEIEAINGEIVKGKLTKDVYKIISKTNKVRLKVKRLPDEVSLEQIDFQKAHFYETSTDRNSNHYVTLRIPKFSEGLAKALQPRLQSLETSARGIIIDLRGNPGGLVDEASAVIGLVTSGKGELFYSEGEYKNYSDLYSHHPYRLKDSAVYHKPIVVLVDSDTASASEIMASVLQQRGRAVILGDKTFGKGSVQIHQYVGPRNGFGGVLIITTSLIYYPYAQSHQLHGVIPDFKLSDPFFTLAITILEKENSPVILYESDHDHVLQPHNAKLGQKPYFPTFTMDLKEKYGDNEPLETCQESQYQACLEKQAIDFLESMIASL